MRRLLPGPDVPTTIEEAYAAPLGGEQSRPWCTLSMVASIDGSTAVAGASGGLSSANDTAVLERLRRLADVLVVGAGTFRAERYARPAKEGQRVGIVTASGNLDVGRDLFTSGAGFVITTERTEIAHDVDVLRAGEEELDFRLMLERLPDLCGPCRVVQAEGGARLNGALLDADVLDEIDVTTSPLAVGGAGPRLTSGADEHAARFDLAQLLVDDESFLYSRWRRRT